MKGTKVLTLGAVGMSSHGFTGHSVSSRGTQPYLPLAHAHYFMHTKWPTVVSRTEVVDADLCNRVFSEKILRLN